MNNLIIPEINKIFKCDILADNKQRKNVDGRIAFSNYMRTKYKTSFHKIGNMIGKGHATVMHHIEMHNNLMEYDLEYRERYKRIGVYSIVKRWLCIECEFKIKTYK